MWDGYCVTALVRFDLPNGAGPLLLVNNVIRPLFQIMKRKCMARNRHTLVLPSPAFSFFLFGHQPPKETRVGWGEGKFSMIN